MDDTIRKIGVIGGGVSGLTAAFRLAPHYDVTIFEANDYWGGHSHTVDVETRDGSVPIDTGFIVFNDRTYPQFTRLLQELHIPAEPTEMSFSVRSDRSGVEYCGSHLRGLLAQPTNLLRPRFLGMLRDFSRFSRQAHRILSERDGRKSWAFDDITVDDFLREHRYSRGFVEDYFLPMGSAIWSCPRATFGEFPIGFILEFYHHHGLLTLRGRPQWMTVRGGARRYVEAMRRGMRVTAHLKTPVISLQRLPNAVRLTLNNGQSAEFDHVVMACHSDQALRILRHSPTPTERELLSAFPYERNIAYLHTDTSLLPRSRRAWASWNYFVSAEETERAAVTYNMNILQHLPTTQTYCVTLNGEPYVRDREIIDEYCYEHPVFTRSRKSAQSRHAELIHHYGVSYCGAYWGNGFHEDGVESALAVCRRLFPRQSQPRSGDSDAIVSL